MAVAERTERDKKEEVNNYLKDQQELTKQRKGGKKGLWPREG